MCRRIRAFLISATRLIPESVLRGGPECILGRTGLVDACFAFAGITPEFYIAGDANLLSFESLTHGGETKANDATTHGTIRHAMYTAYTAASNL